MAAATAMATGRRRWAPRRAHVPHAAPIVTCSPRTSMERHRGRLDQALQRKQQRQTQHHFRPQAQMQQTRHHTHAQKRRFWSAPPLIRSTFIIMLLACSIGSSTAMAVSLRRAVALGPDAMQRQSNPVRPSFNARHAPIVALVERPELQLAALQTAPLSAVPALSSTILYRSIAPVVGVISLCLIGLLPVALKLLLLDSSDANASKRKLLRRVGTGCSLGILVSMWIFSGTYAFLGVFTLMACIAQNEYYLMARQNGCYPTWKLGTLGSLAMYVAACSERPIVRDALFPLTGTITIVYLLLRQERKTPPTTMHDVATTFMGIYYFGYMPSFWIRLRCIGAVEPSAVFAAFAPLALRTRWPLAPLEAAAADLFSVGAIVQWWTMLAIVAADVCAYFAGKRFGRTQLIAVSPNKTWEGLLGGCGAAVAVSVIGAVLMRWPAAPLTGAAYGLVVAVMALIGDLTVSLLKRSAKVKDTGSILPGHGGLLDRLDSYLLVAAPAYFFIKVLFR